MKFLVANFRIERGEIDLVFRDADCLQYVEIGVTGPRSCRGADYRFGLQVLSRRRRLAT
jgi:Holliday junction resolvase-like predicted endonuclease